MKILHLNNFFDLNGGAEIYLHRLLELQQAAGHEVHVLAGSSPKDLPSRDSKFFVARYTLNRRDDLVTDLKKARNFIWNAEAKRATEQMLVEFQPDVVHLHNVYHHLSTSVLDPIRRRKLPCVQTLHDYKLACPNHKMFTQNVVCERCKGGKYLNAVRYSCLPHGFVPNLMAALEMGWTKYRQAYERTVRLFLCPSRFMLEKMTDWGEPSGKLRHLANPTDVRSEPVRGGGGYVLFAGTLSVEKGLQSFLEAACQVPELPIKIAGRGPEAERLRSFVRSKGAAHIEFLGFQTPAILSELRARAEAFVSPSVWYENSSLSVLEALGDGLPCLVSRIGGNPELVEDSVNGFLAAPNDPKDWLRVLRRFLALTPEARRHMGEAGLKRVRQAHNWNEHQNKLIEFYLEAGARN